MNNPPLFSEYDGSPVNSAAELNYVTLDTCDECSKPGEGIMLHAAGATGRCCPVMFFCFVCHPELRP